MSQATVLPILRYPDPKLHTVAKPVAAVDDRIKALVQAMLATMYDANGIGLAATQVDVHERVIVIDISEARDEPLVLINPEVSGKARRPKSPKRDAYLSRVSTTASRAPNRSRCKRWMKTDTPEK